MKLRTTLAITAAFLSFITFSSAQNCGNILAFTADIVNNNNGTHSYTFHVTIQATSGGSKSVNLTIQCPNNTFISNVCEASLSTTRIVDFGPYTVNTCTGNIELIWSGHSNAVCGGTTCNTQQRLALPVELAKFEVENKGSAVLLSWATATELNNEKFVVERSPDGSRFEPIGEVGGNGTTIEWRDYTFLDKDPLPGVNYYRLKQMDFDGNTDFSPIETVMLQDFGEIALYPTLTAGELTLQLPEDAEDETRVSVFSLQGALVFETMLEGNHPQYLDISSLHAGQYLVCVYNGNLAKRAMILKK